MTSRPMTHGARRRRRRTNLVSGGESCVAVVRLFSSPDEADDDADDDDDENDADGDAADDGGKLGGETVVLVTSERWAICRESRTHE